METSFWKKKIVGLYYYEIGIALAISLLLIIIGSFADLSISKAIVHPGNFYGKICAFIGELPFYALLGSIGVFFFLSHFNKEESPFVRFNACLLLVLFPLASGFAYGYEGLSDVISSRILSYILGIVLVVGADVGLYFLFRKTDASLCSNYARYLFWTSCFVFGLVFALKILDARPRYLLLIDETYGARLDFFAPWWDASFGSALKGSLTSQYPNIPSSYFTSFPSGHSAFAAASMTICLFPTLNKKLENKQHWFFYGTLAFTLLIGLGRLLDGSHYLSDIGFGYLIGFAFAFFFLYFFYQKKVYVGDPSASTK